MIRSLIDKLIEIYRVDKAVNEHFNERLKKSQRILAVIAAAGFGIMSILNIIQDSDGMLWSTLGSAVVCLVGYILGKLLNRKTPVEAALVILLLVLFPTYTYLGGNDGFACMWVIIVAYMDVYFLGFRIGIAVNLAYTAMLFVLFYGLIPGFHSEAYTATFLFRFPVFFLINEVAAVFLVESIRSYQYDLILKQKQLEDLSIMDMNTNIYNRNGYIKWTEEFQRKGVDCLGYVYIDANGLHDINNNKGHAEGDKFLKAIADYCKSCFPGQNVFRLGGDEFLVTTCNLGRDEVIANIWQVKAGLKKHGWNIAYGVEFRDDKSDFDAFGREEMLKESNRLMLLDKAAFYSHTETDRRHSRI